MDLESAIDFLLVQGGQGYEERKEEIIQVQNITSEIAEFLFVVVSLVLCIMCSVVAEHTVLASVCIYPHTTLVAKTTNCYYSLMLTLFANC